MASLQRLASTVRSSAFKRSSLAGSSSASSSSSLFSSPQRRCLHNLPQLPAAINTGCSPFISAATVDMLWNQWQAGLLQRLNAEIRGTEIETATLLHTVISSASRTDRILAFNLASQALNNAFFMNGLLPPPAERDWQNSEPPKPTGVLGANIEDQFGSIESFKNNFSAAALGMASSGCLWLVQDQRKRFGIIPTYGAGTILVQNRLQRGLPEVESNAAVPPEGEPRTLTTEFTPPLPSSNDDYYGAASDASSADQASIGREVFPLLCLSLYEHNWMPDYGVWGKESYLARFWECVDWSKVADMHARYTPY